MKRLLIILAIALTANITACSQKKVDDNESGNNKVVEEQKKKLLRNPVYGIMKKLWTL
ncbi:hypothetical protein H9X78_00405 [Clostridium saudiense]|nr:hypothetical protein [Clostridium saudiense]